MDVKFNKYLEEIILEVEKELEEETTTGDIAGFDIPGAFGAGRKKDKEKTKSVATQAGYEVVNEQYVFIKVKNKKIAIGVSDLDDLKRGQDVVGINVKYPSQQEWIHPKIDKWKLVREAKKPLGKARPKIVSHYNESVNESNKRWFNDKKKWSKERDKLNVVDDTPTVSYGDKKKVIAMWYNDRGEGWISESKKPQPRKNRWLELKNDDTMHTNKKLAVGLKELKYQLREVEKFLGWYGKLKNINELDSDTYWKRTNNNIRNIKERIINIARKLQEIEK